MYIYIYAHTHKYIYIYRHGILLLSTIYKWDPGPRALRQKPCPMADSGGVGTGPGANAGPFGPLWTYFRISCAMFITSASRAKCSLRKV